MGKVRHARIPPAVPNSPAAHYRHHRLRIASRRRAGTRRRSSNTAPIACGASPRFLVRAILRSRSGALPRTAVGGFGNTWLDDWRSRPPDRRRGRCLGSRCRHPKRWGISVGRRPARGGRNTFPPSLTKSGTLMGAGERARRRRKALRETEERRPQPGRQYHSWLLSCLWVFAFIPTVAGQVFCGMIRSGCRARLTAVS